MKKIIIASLVIFAFTLNAFSQPFTANATATATIISPLSITHVAGTDTELAFGNIIANAAAGTATVIPAGTISYSIVSAPAAIPGAHTAATFTVGGAIGATYTIVLPTTDVTISDGTNSMTVNNFQSTPSGTSTLATATEVLRVGGRLNVGASQAAGDYTGTFSVTVNYN